MALSTASVFVQPWVGATSGRYVAVRLSLILVARLRRLDSRFSAEDDAEDEEEGVVSPEEYARLGSVDG